uniref:protein disulfide-isomerase n=1 Tax=Amphilophus citrinellus TaxID=61819 RepID=A0A3Q0R5Q7_AMPCI
MNSCLRLCLCALHFMHLCIFCPCCVSLQFYAPWCTFCKQLDPVWHQIGSEFRSLGSPVHVGKSDATANTGLAKEFRVKTYPAILMLKKNVKYNYSGARTKEGIMDFANRIAGPLVRSLSSVQLFQHAMSRHDVMFVYVGATSPLKVHRCAAKAIGNLLVHAAVSLASLPAVVVFKDGTYFTYSEERDGDLKSWINRERFPTFSQIDSYTLYAMGETGNAVHLSTLYKSLVENVAAEHRETYTRNMYFGFMAGSDYINGLVMGEVIIPSFIVVNLSNDGYFLPPGAMETERHLLDFLDGVLDGSVESHGGNGVVQRVRRLVYETRITLTAPLLGCFLVGFPLTIGACFCYLCCKARPTMGGDDDDDCLPLLVPSLQGPKKTSKKKSD